MEDSRTALGYRNFQIQLQGILAEDLAHVKMEWMPLFVGARAHLHTKILVNTLNVMANCV